MNYAKVVFKSPGPGVSDILIAQLNVAGFEGFEEGEDYLFAFIQAPMLDRELLDQVSASLIDGYEVEMIPAQNWNALWESNFQPVVVADFCTIRAHFHTLVVTTPHEIVVTPKMSFGTGHHATTQLMIAIMRDIPMSGSEVVDFGTGTGVLAILAEQLGAASVLAIDYDIWSVENAGENAARNHCERIRILQGSIEDTPVEEADLMLANINRHILLQYMPDIYARVKPGGKVLMSGLLVDDQPVIEAAAAQAGLLLQRREELNNWIALLFIKP